MMLSRTEDSSPLLFGPVLLVHVEAEAAEGQLDHLLVLPAPSPRKRRWPWMPIPTPMLLPAGPGEGRLSRLPEAAAAAGEDCAALMVVDDGVTDAGRTSGRLERRLSRRTALS